MTNFEYFIKEYRNSGLLIDANLLIVLLVGNTDEGFITKVKATKEYTKKDYQLLTEIVKHFKIVTTPHILTEASNLCTKEERYYKEKIYQSLSDTIIDLIEIQTPSGEATKTPVFLKFGLTDSVIFKLAQEGFIVLTEDFNLYSYLIGHDCTAANMNHFRTGYLIE